MFLVLMPRAARLYTFAVFLGLTVAQNTGQAGD